MGSQERFHRYQGRNFESFVIRCLWMLMLLTAETFATEFIPVSRCPDVNPEQSCGFVCSDAKDKLHCILEEDNHKLGLVCTHWAWMDTNMCPIFSFSQKGIKFHPCSGNNTLCPSSVSAYKSFEAYKYPGCFIGKDMLTATKATTQTTTAKETTQATTTTKTESDGSDTKYLHLGLTQAASVTTNPDSVTMSEINRSRGPPEDVPVLIILLVMSVISVMLAILNAILIVIFRKPIKRWLKRFFYPSEKHKTSSEQSIVNNGSTDEEDPNEEESKKETSDKDPKNDTKIHSEHQNSTALPEFGSLEELNVNQREEENKGADRPLTGGTRKIKINEKMKLYGDQRVEKDRSAKTSLIEEGAERPLIRKEHMTDTDSGSVGKCDVHQRVEESEGAERPLIGEETDTPESIIKTFC